MRRHATGASRAVNAAQRARNSELRIESDESGKHPRRGLGRACVQRQRTVSSPVPPAALGRRLPTSCCICNTKLFGGFLGEFCRQGTLNVSADCGERRGGRKCFTALPPASLCVLSDLCGVQFRLRSRRRPRPAKPNTAEIGGDAESACWTGRHRLCHARCLSLRPRPHAVQPPSRRQTVLTPNTAPDTILILPCHARFASSSPIWNRRAL